MTRYFVVIAAFLYAFGTTVRAEQFIGMGSHYASSATIDRTSISPVDGDAYGAWFRAGYGMSIDCSPPRGCYAASQQAYLKVKCRARAVAVVQKLSMDINGTIVAASDVDPNPLYYRPPGGTLEGRAVVLMCGTGSRSREDED